MTAVVARSVLITGAARRLGAQMARSLAAEGYRISLHCNTSTVEAERLCAEIRDNGGICRILPADLTLPDQMASLFDPHQEHPYTLLINNASVFRKESLAGATLSMNAAIFQVNLFAPMELSRHFAAQTRSGQIINILDSAACRDNPDFAAYILSKRALADFTRLAAVAFAPGIRVNAIAPGVILPPDHPLPEMRIPDPSRLPLRAHPRPEALLQTIRFLEASPDITGEIIHIDGGMHLCTK